MEKQHCVYILTDNENSLLYTGRTNNLKRRVDEHRKGSGAWFTRKYALHKLVYFEQVEDIRAAMKREKQIKACSKKRKLTLIMGINPEWRDLYEDLT